GMHRAHPRPDHRVRGETVGRKCAQHADLYRPEATAAREDKGGLSVAGAGAFRSSPECGKVAHGCDHFNWPLSRRMPSSRRVAATFTSCLPPVMPASGVTRPDPPPTGPPTP